MRQPGLCARALCEAVAVLLSKNMTCARPRCNATPSEDFPLTSHCTLHTLHFALHTCTSHSTLHLTSNHVSSSHLISALLISSHLFSPVIKVSSSQLFSSHPGTDQPFSSPRSCLRAYTIRPFSSIELACAVRQPGTVRALPSTTLYYKACTKLAPVLLLVLKLHRILKLVFF